MAGCTTSTGDLVNYSTGLFYCGPFTQSAKSPKYPYKFFRFASPLNMALEWGLVTLREQVEKIFGTISRRRLLAFLTLIYLTPYDAVLFYACLVAMVIQAKRRWGQCGK